MVRNQVFNVLQSLFNYYYFINNNYVNSYTAVLGGKIQIIYMGKYSAKLYEYTEDNELYICMNILFGNFKNSYIYIILTYYFEFPGRNQNVREG